MKGRRNYSERDGNIEQNTRFDGDIAVDYIIILLIFNLYTCFEISLVNESNLKL